MAAITRREFGLVALVGLPVLSSSVELRGKPPESEPCRAGSLDPAWGAV